MFEGTLGDRMKHYENQYRRVLPRRTYTILRLDGKAFHTFTKPFNKPWDDRIVNAMLDATAELYSDTAGSKIAYTQSDEISLLLTDFDNPNTEPWMGGVEAKILSVSSSIVTASFNEYIGDGMRAYFDARLFTLDDDYEVYNYFLWRQRDAIKNSITGLAHKYFSHNDLHGVNTAGRLEMLSEIGVGWEDLEPSLKYGTFIDDGEFHSKKLEKREDLYVPIKEQI